MSLISVLIASVFAGVSVCLTVIFVKMLDIKNILLVIMAAVFFARTGHILEVILFP